jgi:hypothetical protein
VFVGEYPPVFPEASEMPQGDKSSYTGKQKRQAEHIAEGYEERGTGRKEAKRRAWATVNAASGGGKKSGSGRGKKTNTAPFKKGGKKGGKKAGKKAGRKGGKKGGKKAGKKGGKKGGRKGTKKGARKGGRKKKSASR